MVCTSCGSQIVGQGKFCATCGARLPQAAAVPPAAATPPDWSRTVPPPPPAAPYGSPQYLEAGQFPAQYSAPQYPAAQYGAPQYAAPQWRASGSNPAMAERCPRAAC